MLLRIAINKDFENFKPSQCDLLEAQASGISASYPSADQCIVLEDDSKVLAIGGHDGGGRCWFVTSEDVAGLSDRKKLRFRRFIMDYRDFLLETNEVLWNYVWRQNQSHIDFLKTIGAVFHDEALDREFVLFTINRR